MTMPDGGDPAVGTGGTDTAPATPGFTDPGNGGAPNGGSLSNLGPIVLCAVGAVALLLFFGTLSIDGSK